MSDYLNDAVHAMRKRGFTVLEAATREEAAMLVLAQLQGVHSVGIGGSTSIKELNLIPDMLKAGITVWSHTGAKPEEKETIRRKAMEADAYLCSANAVTRSGRLVLVDGTGNRLAAVCFGPKKLIFVISHSKVVDGDWEKAMERIKTIAAPLNACRLNLPTPCAETGVCGGMNCTHSICNLCMAVDGLPTGRTVTVIFTKEKLGY